MQIARVFLRRTQATPLDELAFSCKREGDYPLPPMFPLSVDEVHICWVYSYDEYKLDTVVREWERIAPVKVGGPAAGTRGEEFTPGMYVKPGYVITSRGCPNSCWFCSVWRRDGDIRELPIHDGWNVLDDNLLACSEAHIRAVFAMLKRQGRKAEFTGGLEAARLEQWHVELLADLKPKQMFFAYDTPDDLEPLMQAGRMLLDAGFTTDSHRLRCYVLIGHPRDSFEDAERRLRQTIDAGFFPMAMLYRDKAGKRDPQWVTFQRQWANPTILGTK